MDEKKHAMNSSTFLKSIVYINTILGVSWQCYHLLRMEEPANCLIPQLWLIYLSKLCGWRAGNLNWPIRIQQEEELYCPEVNVSWQEWHWNQVTFLTRDGIAFSRIKKGLAILKPILDYKKWKIWNISLPPSFQFDAKSGWQLSRSRSSVPREDNSCVILNKICYSSSNQTRNSS